MPEWVPTSSGSHAANTVEQSENVGGGWRCSRQGLVRAPTDQSGEPDFTFNPFKDVNAMNERYTGDQAVTDEVMTRCAQSAANGGPLCILSNHTLSQVSTAASSVVAPVYAEIDSLWTKMPSETPVDLQTVSPDQLDLCPAIGVAIAHHAQSVEVWPDNGAVPGFSGLSQSTLTTLAEALASGRSPSC
jgi:hypothetical protein